MTFEPAAACPNSDHEDIYVPATRRITVGAESAPDVDEVRCSYCSEGRVAQLLRAGLRVTIQPLAPSVDAYELTVDHD